MLLKNDKIILCENIHSLKAGTEFYVMGINEDSISFRNDCIGQGIMSLKEFEKYFKKVEKREFCEWTFSANNYGFYWRNNGKVTQVKLITGEKSSSTCHKDDEFDEEKGIKIAFLRAELKRLTR